MEQHIREVDAPVRAPKRTSRGQRAMYTCVGLLFLAPFAMSALALAGFISAADVLLRLWILLLGLGLAAAMFESAQSSKGLSAIFGYLVALGFAIGGLAGALEMW
jgi:hypothetical protein